MLSKRSELSHTKQRNKNLRFHYGEDYVVDYVKDYVMEKIDYKIAWELGYARLQDRVNELIADGYVPVGGICVFPHTGKDINDKDELRLGCSQALVKKV